MNAQGQWLREYRTLKTYISGGARKNQRGVMRRFRREAALERKLAAAQRTIEAQRQGAIKFSRQHYYGTECDPQVDPQDWHDFDVVFGIYEDESKP